MSGALFKWRFTIEMSYDTALVWLATPPTAPVACATGLTLLTTRKILFLG